MRQLKYSTFTATIQAVHPFLGHHVYVEYVLLELAKISLISRILIFFLGLIFTFSVTSVARTLKEKCWERIGDNHTVCLEIVFSSLCCDYFILFDLRFKALFFCMHFNNPLLQNRVSLFP